MSKGNETNFELTSMTIDSDYINKEIEIPILVC